jgi:hypothetical protein
MTTNNNGWVTVQKGSAYNPNVVSVPLQKSSAVGMAELMAGLKDMDNEQIEELIRKLRALAGALENRTEYRQPKAPPVRSRLANDGGTKPGKPVGSRLANDGGVNVAKAGEAGGLMRWATGRWG